MESGEGSAYTNLIPTLRAREVVSDRPLALEKTESRWGLNQNMQRGKVKCHRQMPPSVLDSKVEPPITPA